MANALAEAAGGRNPDHDGDEVKSTTTWRSDVDGVGKQRGRQWRSGIEETKNAEVRGEGW